jgi:hypothetical protein
MKAMRWCRRDLVPRRPIAVRGARWFCTASERRPQDGVRYTDSVALGFVAGCRENFAERDSRIEAVGAGLFFGFFLGCFL